VTHGLGAVLAIAGLVVLVAYATRYGDSWHIVSSAVFGSTLVLMYTASTLYHSIPLPRARKVLRIIDHTMIYFLIAGSYTPFTLVTLHGAWGWILFGITWGLALAGAVFKVFATGRFRKLSLTIYLGMGWCVIVAIRPLIETLDGLSVRLTQVRASPVSARQHSADHRRQAAHGIPRFARISRSTRGNRPAAAGRRARRSGAGKHGFLPAHAARAGPRIAV
jgi:channel protein (hemolysin III family)